MKILCGCCEGIEVLTPTTIANRPGLSAINYRAGIHPTFLETMKARLCLALIVVAVSAAPSLAAERVWQKGVWREVRVTRPRIVVGLQPSPNAPGPYMPGMIVIRTYVIETDQERFELTERAPEGRRTVDALVGEEVTFAVERNTVYVRGAGGMEHRLRVTKKRVKSPQ